MPRAIYILVADSGRARLYKSNPTRSALELVYEQDNPAGRKTRSELDSDRPGMQRNGSGGLHGLGGDADSSRHESGQFARTLGKLLQTEHHAGKFNDLMIAAPPQFLGELRQHLSQACLDVLSQSVNKNLLHADDKALLAHFA